MNRRSFAVVLVSLTTLAFCPAVVACSATAAAPDAPVQLAPSPSDFIWTVMNSKALGTAVVDLTTNVTTPGGSRTWHGTGSAALGEDLGIIDWTGYETYRELLNPLAIYVQSESPNWTRKEWDSPTQTAGSVDVLRRLVEATTVARDGSTISLQLPMTTAELIALGLTPDEVAQLADTWQGTMEEIRVHLGPSGTIDEVRRHYSNRGIVIDSTADLSDFGQPFDVSAPESHLLN